MRGVIVRAFDFLACGACCRCSKCTCNVNNKEPRTVSLGLIADAILNFNFIITRIDNTLFLLVRGYFSYFD